MFFNRYRDLPKPQIHIVTTKPSLCHLDRHTVPGRHLIIAILVSPAAKHAPGGLILAGRASGFIAVQPACHKAATPSTPVKKLETFPHNALAHLNPKNRNLNIRRAHPPESAPFPSRLHHKPDTSSPFYS